MVGEVFCNFGDAMKAATPLATSLASYSGGRAIGFHCTMAGTSSRQWRFTVMENFVAFLTGVGGILFGVFLMVLLVGWFLPLEPIAEAQSDNLASMANETALMVWSSFRRR